METNKKKKRKEKRKSIEGYNREDIYKSFKIDRRVTL